MERVGIGGSDWGDVLGLLPYGCERRFVLSRNGTDPDFVEETGPMRRGHILEPHVAQEFSKVTGHKLRKVRRSISAADTGLPGWWTGHPDYEMYGGPAMGWGPVEIKTCNPRTFSQLRNEGAPASWLAQLQSYIALMGKKWGVIVALEPLSWDIYPGEMIRRDDWMIGGMIAAGNKAMKMVEDGELPDLLPIGDRRCKRCAFRLTCWGAPTKVEVIENGGEEVRIWDDAVDGAVKTYLQLKSQIDDLTEEADLVEQRIRDSLGERRGKFRTGSGAVHYVPTTRRTIDEKLLRKEQPEIAKKYERVSYGTRLTIKC